MKSVKIKSLTSVRIIALVFGLLIAGAIMFGTKQTALAVPSKCAVITDAGKVGPKECSKKMDGITDDMRKILTVPGTDDKCYLVTYNGSATNPKVEEKSCATDEPFKTANVEKVKRNTALFNECNNSDDPSDNCVGAYITTAINFLSVGVVIVVIIMVIVGGIRYSAAGGDAQKVAAAKQQIFNALLALLAYIFLFTFLQWVTPGGWL